MQSVYSPSRLDNQIDGTLPGTIIPGERCNEGVLHNPQSSKILTVRSNSVFYTEQTFIGGVLPLYKGYNLRILNRNGKIKT